MFQTKCCRENLNTYFTFNNFFRKLYNLQMEKYCRQATDAYMAHEHYILDTYAYKHTLNM